MLGNNAEYVTSSLWRCLGNQAEELGLWLTRPLVHPKHLPEHTLGRPRGHSDTASAQLSPTGDSSMTQASLG